MTEHIQKLIKEINSDLAEVNFVLTEPAEKDNLKSIVETYTLLTNITENYELIRDDIYSIELNKRDTLHSEEQITSYLDNLNNSASEGNEIVNNAESDIESVRDILFYIFEDISMLKDELFLKLLPKAID